MKNLQINFLATKGTSDVLYLEEHSDGALAVVLIESPLENNLETQALATWHILIEDGEFDTVISAVKKATEAFNYWRGK